MAEKIDLGTFEFDTSAILKETSELKKRLDDLKAAQRELAKQNDTSSAAYVKNAADIKVLNKEYNTNITQLAKASKATAEQTVRTKTLNAALGAEVTTIEEAREQNKALTKLRNTANASTEEGQKEITKLNAKLDENNAFIKENVDQYTQQKINVGNYTESIKGAFSGQKLLNTAMNDTSQLAPMVGNGIRAVTTAIGGMIKASLAFLATPIGAAIALIGGALALVVNYLKSTQAGIDAVTSVTRPMVTVFQTLLGVVQSAGKALFDAFSNPKQLLTDLSDFVKQNLINRFTAFGKILEGIINLDFKTVADGVLQAGTGIEDLTGKIANSAKATNDFFGEAINRGREIDRLTKEIEKAEVNINKLQAESNNQMKELEVISKNTSLSIQERIKAANEITEIANRQRDEEEKIIQLKIERLKLEQQSNDTNREGYKELANLEAELVNIRTRAKEIELRNIRVVADAAKQARAEAINFNKEELSLFLTTQGVKKKSLEEELEIAEEVSRRKIELAEKEFQNSEKKASDRIALERTIAEAENELLLKQSEVAVSNAERELEIFKQTLSEKANLNSIFTDEYLNQERARLQATFDQEQEFAALKLEQGLINQQEYQDAIRALELEKRLENQALDAEVEEARKADKLERDIAEFELEQERLAEQGATAFELEQERLAYKYEQDQSRLQESLSAQQISQENFNAQSLLLEKQNAAAKEDIDQAYQNAKLSTASDAFGGVAKLLGEETAAGKAAGIAQATINTYQGVTSVLAAPSLIPEPIGSIAKGIAAAGILASGLVNVKKIASTKVPKMEQGGIMEIKGKRHSQGGEPIYVGSQYVGEAEAGEGVGILNRRAYGSFLNYNNSFANGGIISPSSITGVQDSINESFNEAQMASVIGNAVREGSLEGSRQGSAVGSQEGIVGLSENRAIQQQALD